MADDSMRRQVDELVRYLAELGRAMGTAGVRDLGELFELVDRVQRALGAVSAQEIAWAIERATAVEQALRVLDEQLDTVRQLKGMVADLPEPPR